VISEIIIFGEEEWRRRGQGNLFFLLGASCGRICGDFGGKSIRRRPELLD